MASLYKRGQSWYLHWTEGGIQKKLSLGKISRAEAKIAQNQKEALIYESNRPLFISGSRFDRFAVKYYAWYEQEYPASASTAQLAIDKYLIPHFGYHSLGTVTRQLVEEYKHWRLQTVAAGTVKRELQILQAIFNKAVEWKEIRENPIKGVKPPKNLNSKPIRFYSVAELQIIYAAQAAQAPIWKLLSNTGLRRSEAIRLRWKHIQTGSLQVVSASTGRTKSGKHRIIPLPHSAQDALKQLKNDSEYVLPQIQAHSLTTAFKRVLTKAGLDGNLHCLRHTYAAHLIMRGVPIYTVSQLLGHASIETTQIYAHLSDEHMANAVENLDL